MTPGEAIATVRALGGSVLLAGGLRFRLPRGKLTADLQSALTEHRDELAALERHRRLDEGAAELDAAFTRLDRIGRWRSEHLAPCVDLGRRLDAAARAWMNGETDDPAGWKAALSAWEAACAKSGPTPTEAAAARPAGSQGAQGALWATAGGRR